MESTKKRTDGEQITIKQEQKEHNFIIVYDSVYKNTELTAQEIGLLIKLISCAPSFKPTKTKLINILNTTKHELEKAMKGLQDKGYLKIKKFGRSSEWTITQEPFINRINDLSTEGIVNALLDFRIDLKAVDRLHKLKYIDDSQYIKIINDHAKEAIRRAKYNAYED